MLIRMKPAPSIESVDGALGAQFLQDFKNSIEDPNLLI
jgi:pyruvate/2-oxoglutarate dehydrogenase complex dihydrolipoamide acyltransferase (E2) component